MKIVGCDLHTRYQQIAMLEEETGEMVERRLEAGGSPFRLISYPTLRKNDEGWGTHIVCTGRPSGRWPLPLDGASISHNRNGGSQWPTASAEPTKHIHNSEGVPHPLPVCAKGGQESVTDPVRDAPLQFRYAARS